MKKDDELLRIKIAKATEVISIVVAAGGTVLLVKKVFDTGFVMGANREALKHELIKDFNEGKISITATANSLSKLGYSDEELTTLLAPVFYRCDTYGYNSGEIRQRADLDEKGLRIGYTEDDASDSKGDNYKKGDTDLAIEFANSFSEYAQKNPKLQVDLGKNEVDSYSNHFGERAGRERYQLVDPTSIGSVRPPAGRVNSIVGRGVNVLLVVILISFIFDKLVFKPKETVVDTKQNDILTKEKEEK